MPILVISNHLQEVIMDNDSFLELAKHPVIIFGELLVVIAGIYHGLNGVRIGLTTFSDTSPYQKVIFYIFFIITVVGSLIFTVRMFTA